MEISKPWILGKTDLRKIGAVLTFDGTIRRSGVDSTLVPIPNPTRNKSIVPRRTMHTGRMSVTLPRRTLITMSVITMRSRQFPANSASDCLRFLKFRTQFCESCGAIYRWICETFSPLQSTSGPLTDVVNSVQIEA